MLACIDVVQQATHSAEAATVHCYNLAELPRAVEVVKADPLSDHESVADSHSRSGLHLSEGVAVLLTLASEMP